MLVSVLGRVTFVSPLHLKKASSPMLVSVLGKVTAFRDEHPENILAGIDVLPWAMFKVSNVVFLNTSVP